MITRRRLLGLFLVAGTGLGSLAALIFRKRPPAPVSKSPSGVDTLVAAAEVIIGLPVELDHYRSYFDWRWQQLPGAAARYTGATVALEREAQATAGRGFAECDAAVRAQIWQQVQNTTAAELTALRGVQSETLQLFAKTDLWIQLGYESWPGTARGLEGYRRDPRARR